jgi:hypothetical protein
MSAARWLPLTPDSASGYLQQSRLIRSAYPTMPRRNATNHTNRRGRDCPSAPAMRHSGGANLTPACTVSHEMLSSKRKSSSLAGTARTAAFGQFGSPLGGAWRRRRRPASSATARRLMRPRQRGDCSVGRAAGWLRLPLRRRCGAGPMRGVTRLRELARGTPSRPRGRRTRPGADRRAWCVFSMGGLCRGRRQRALWAAVVREASALLRLRDRTWSQEDSDAIGVANQRDRDVTARGRLRDATRRTSEVQIGEPLESRLHINEVGEHEEPGRRVRGRVASRDIATDEGV